MGGSLGIRCVIASPGILNPVLEYGVKGSLKPGWLDPRRFWQRDSYLAGVGLVASHIPARRATKIDPVTTLRVE
jgi:hypothetical protein